MVAKTREIGTAAVVGVVVDGILTGVLGATSLNLLYAIIIGAFAGGIAASYVLYGAVREAALAGLLSGAVAVPFLLGVSDILTIFGLIPIPSPPPQPTMAELQGDVAAILMFNLLASSLGSIMLGAIRHPQPSIQQDRKSTRLNSSHTTISRMPSSA